MLVVCGHVYIELKNQLGISPSTAIPHPKPSFYLPEVHWFFGEGPKSRTQPGYFPGSTSGGAPGSATQSPRSYLEFASAMAAGSWVWPSRYGSLKPLRFDFDFQNELRSNHHGPDALCPGCIFEFLRTRAVATQRHEEFPGRAIFGTFHVLDQRNEEAPNLSRVHRHAHAEPRHPGTLHW